MAVRKRGKPQAGDSGALEQHTTSLHQPLLCLTEAAPSSSGRLMRMPGQEAGVMGPCRGAGAEQGQQGDAVWLSEKEKPSECSGWPQPWDAVSTLGSKAQCLWGSGRGAAASKGC